jgi:3-deoxy-7-phosphoheptulonate synthase
MNPLALHMNNRLPEPEILKMEIPVPERCKQIKAARDQALKNIFEGKDSRFILIIGPCSADHEDTVVEYCRRLAEVQEKVKDNIFIVPRVYTNKPRTTGDGYKGMLHQPDPLAEPDLLEGIKAIRRMHLRVLEETGFSTADEMLYPENRSFLDDVLSYEAVGARSVENQQHRLVASGLDLPVGMKNPTSGDFSVLMNSVTAAQHGHRFIYRGYDVQTDGNPYAHVILRGGVDKYGKTIPNYHYEDLKIVYDLYQKTGLKNPAVIIDANHSNSNKQYKEQIRIAMDVMHNRKYHKELRELVKGLMIESYLLEGRQDICENYVLGRSITDPCLGWEDTVDLIMMINDKLEEEKAFPLD